MARPKSTAMPSEQLTVRFPQGMLDILRTKAKTNDRSLNAEIVHELRHCLDNSCLGEKPHVSRRIGRADTP